MAAVKSPATVVKDGVKLEGAYVQNGTTYDKNGSKVDGNFSTQVGGKVFVHTDDSSGGSSKQVASNATTNNVQITQGGKEVVGGYVENGKSYDANGNRITESFTTNIGDKEFNSGKGGDGTYEQDCASNPNAPSNLSQIPTDKLAYGTVYVDGVKKENVPLYDGVFYDSATGKPMTDMHTGTGVLNSSEYKKYYEIGADGKQTAYFTKKTTTSSSSSSDYYYDSEESVYKPVYYPPPKLSFDEPFPTFSSKLKKVVKYNYYFGLDMVEAKKVLTEKNSCWVSQLIHVGGFQESEYLQLDISYFQDENSSIEFYIIDGEKEIPIVPINDSSITNESLFAGIEPRFLIDSAYPVVVKNKNNSCNRTYREVIDQSVVWENTNDRFEYTISYTPIAESWKYKPINSEIAIKAVIRYWDIGEYSPYIKEVSLRKYIKGGLYE